MTSLLASNRARLTASLRPELLPEVDVTFLLSDMVGFSEMTDRLGDREAHRVIQRHHSVVRHALAAHDGEEVELRGDGFYLAFSEPESALRCAIAIQRNFVCDARLHPTQPIRVRIGLHAGSALLDSHSYFGKALIEASRISEQARGGEILVSSACRERVPARANLAFGPGYDLKLRGLQGRRRIFRLLWQTRSEVAVPGRGVPSEPSRLQPLAALSLR